MSKTPSTPTTNGAYNPHNIAKTIRPLVDLKTDDHYVTYAYLLTLEFRKY